MFLKNCWSFVIILIKGRAFIPKPNVDVGVVRLTPLKKPIIDLPFDIIEKVIRSVFSFRQKHCIRGVEWVICIQTIRMDIIILFDLYYKGHYFQNQSENNSLVNY